MDLTFFEADRARKQVRTGPTSSRYLDLTAVFIMMGPSGTFYTQADIRLPCTQVTHSSERFRFGAPLSLLEFPLVQHC